ncbi:Linear gramicidin synthase subunit D [Legionella beliardensis]|uniref:Linear gramicidin synthase subunit D n=1 Tax=Legionella beliardensis TaxID=91822 RepID=A0A378I314_9GAMM|nr:condensation domain-containing protein [Legionella beliardensis]STX29322.1 Linear gramicidin synthase subunit D [Legionella beliardensis]
MRQFNKKTSRKLGYNEVISKCVGDIAEGHLNIIGFSCLQGFFDKSIFNEALQLVVKKQPLLRARLVECEGEKDEFEILEELPVLPVEYIPLNEPINIKNFVEKEQQRFIRSDQTPLWRCVVLYSEKKTFIFSIVHYLITDGKSSFFVLHDVLSFYEKLYRKEKFDVIEYNLLPNFEEIINVKQLAEMPDFFAKNLIVATHTTPAKTECLLPKYIFEEISEDIVTKIQLQCSKNNTTINAFMIAALFLSLDYSDYKQEEIIFGTSIDIRDGCIPKVPYDYLGCYRAFAQTTINIKQNDIWQIAKQYNNDLWESIDKLKINFEKDYNKQSIYEEWIMNKEMVEKKGKSPLYLQLTFSGNLSINNPNSVLKLMSMHGATVQKLGVTLINVHMAILNGKIYFSISFSEPLIMEEQILQIIIRFKALLVKIAR